MEQVKAPDPPALKKYRPKAMLPTITLLREEEESIGQPENDTVLVTKREKKDLNSYQHTHYFHFNKAKKQQEKWHLYSKTAMEIKGKHLYVFKCLTADLNFFLNHNSNKFTLHLNSCGECGMFYYCRTTHKKLHKTS